MDEKIITEYFKSSYFALDGLWFVMVEEEEGYQNALDIDERVWKVLPKIQARKVCGLLGIEMKGIDNFKKALEVKFQAEGYDYEFLDGAIRIKGCPWIDILRKSGRENIAPDIGERICTEDIKGWLKEFSGDKEILVDSLMCEGEKECVFRIE